MILSNYTKSRQEHRMWLPTLVCQQNVKFSHDKFHNADDAKTLAIPQAFFENSRAKKSG